MKTVKRIIYALLGLVLAGAVVLVGIILFAEYSGRRFTPGSAQTAEAIEDDKSRLVYDEDGTVAELPDESAEETVAETETASEEDNIERNYVMDMGANLFHKEDCSYVQDITPEDLSRMTTSRAKILNAGYQPCTHCNP